MTIGRAGGRWFPGLVHCAVITYFATSAILDPEHRYISLFLVFLGVSSMLRFRGTGVSSPHRT